MAIKFREDGSIDLYAEDENSVPAANPQADPNNPTNSANISQGTIYLWNPNAVNRTGLFPDRFPSTVKSLNDLLVLIRDDMSYAERLNLKRKLWSAGYYTSGASSPAGTVTTQEGEEILGAEIRNNLTGNWDGTDEEVIKTLFKEYQEQNKNRGNTGSAIDLDNVFSDRLLTVAGQTREDMVSNYNLQGLYLKLQDFASENVGRQLSEIEVQKIFDQLFAFDQDPGEISATNQWSENNTEIDPLARRQIVTGGGDNSSAINFGRGIAATYNLVVDSSLTMNPRGIGATSEFEEAFREGRAIKITGDRQRMIKLHEWANTQKGSDGVFENVRFIYDGNSNEPTGLLLSMNEGAKIPTMAASNFAYGQRGNDIDKFLDSVKRPGDVYAYSWEGEGPNRRGAYGMSDQIWEFYSNQLGIDSSDTSITSQDRVARAYVTDLWQRYGSWKEVALALRVNEDTANRRKAERATQGDGYVDVVTDPNELSWADQAIAKMGSWQPVLDGSKSTDLYESMYGANSLYTPTNLFAGVPQPGAETENKLMWLAQKTLQGEASAVTILQDVMKNASKRSIRDFSGLERKW
jgi:hypothetical protein